MMADTARGRFITLEGGEGVGKSTLQHTLAERLEDAGFGVVTTREPGGTRLAERLRELALHPLDGETWSPMAEALLMNAARVDHLDKLIRPSLAKGLWVICDRFSDSTRVYQSVGDGVPEDVLIAIETPVLGNTRPDLTLVLDAPPAATEARRKIRDERKDVFEMRPDTFHSAVRQAFLNLVTAEPDRVKLIDASQDAISVADDAWRDVQALFAAEGGGAG
ncbi:dTMP kinase [Hyphomonas sp.]|uniref:dTMP kinase n=1 Tax=Hyphomonas sp. TaxID=87 RepID=UPI0030F7AFD5